MAGGRHELIVVLGVDGAGKNHVANVIVDAMVAAGEACALRAGYLSARDGAARSSEDKGRLRLWEERLFLATFPITRHLLPTLADLLIRADLRRLRARVAGPGSTVVASWTPLRVLAFAAGHRRAAQDIRLPRRLQRSLAQLRDEVSPRVVVLDVSPEVRERRLLSRAERGRLDHFDRYMTAPGHRDLSERIEAALIELAVTHLGATLIVNDDLDDRAILERVASTDATTGQSSRGVRSKSRSHFLRSVPQP